MKKIIVRAVLCVMASVLLFAGCASASVATYTGSGETQTTAMLRIVTMDGEKLFDDEVKVIDDNPTVYMALEAAAEAKELTLDIPDASTPESMFLNGINDLASEEPKYWMFYINKEMAAAGMGTQTFAEGDVIEFIYGDYNAGYVEVK